MTILDKRDDNEVSEQNMRTILLIILVLLLIGALPTWPYSSGWGYYPGGGLLLLIILILLLCYHSHHWQRKTQSQFVLQINLDVMQPELLELHPAKVMDVGGMPFHLL